MTNKKTQQVHHAQQDFTKMAFEKEQLPTALENQNHTGISEWEGLNTSLKQDNKSGGFSDEASQLPSPLATSVGAIIMTLFIIEGLLGNVLILWAIIAKKKVWNIINIFIVSLCINDLLSLCLSVVLIINSYIGRRWMAGWFLCKLNPEFAVFLTGSSLWHTALIAIHRYIVVCHNSFYKRMSKRAYVTFVLISARAIPLAVAIPGFNLQSSTYVPKLLRCIVGKGHKARIISISLVQIIVPCVLVVLFYCLIFMYVCRIARQMRHTNVMLQREIHITKMFGVIFLMILWGFIPYTIVRNADKANNFHADIYVIVTVFYGVATCLNPLVYGAMSTELRLACIQSINDFLKLTHIGGCLVRLCPCLNQAKHPGNGSLAEMATLNNQTGTVGGDLLDIENTIAVSMSAVGTMTGNHVDSAEQLQNNNTCNSDSEN